MVALVVLVVLLAVDLVDNVPLAPPSLLARLEEEKVISVQLLAPWLRPPPLLAALATRLDPPLSEGLRVKVPRLTVVTLTRWLGTVRTLRFALVVGGAQADAVATALQKLQVARVLLLLAALFLAVVLMPRARLCDF